MRYKVLVSSRSLQLVLKRFRAELEQEGIELVVPPVIQRLSEAELLEYVKDVDGVLAGDDFFTEKVLRNAPQLKVISKWGTGLDSIRLDVCQELNITVKNTPDAFTDPVADSTLAYLLLFSRGIMAVDADMRAGIWRKYQHRALRECTLGIIGMGRIGQAVARRAQTFGMNILGADPRVVPTEFLEETAVDMVSRDDLLAQSDFVSLHCDLNTTSRNLISTEQLALMKSNAYLVNMARGGVVDEAALVDALKKKRIAGAALDVFVMEPLPPEHELFQLDNVLLSPHCANSSPLAYEYVYRNTIDNLIVSLRSHSAAPARATV